MNKVYDIVTERIVALLEQGHIPWRKPWTAGYAPQNLISRRPYTGINPWMLSSAGYKCPFWLTYRQAQEKGGSVRKGEKGQLVVFYKIGYGKDKHSGEERKLFMLRYYTVFNLEQCEGIVAPTFQVREFKPIEEAERIVREMPQRPRIEHHGNQACYRPALDTVTMPHQETFKSDEEYYSTLFHELVHSTGHKSRLNREEISRMSGFGSEPYSKEELVAEFGSAFLCAHLGIEQTTLTNSAAYIQGWASRLKNDKTLIIRAASSGQRAATYILNHKEETDGLSDSSNTTLVTADGDSEDQGDQVVAYRAQSLPRRSTTRAHGNPRRGTKRTQRLIRH